MSTTYAVKGWKPFYFPMRQVSKSYRESNLLCDWLQNLQMPVSHGVTWREQVSNLFKRLSNYNLLLIYEQRFTYIIVCILISMELPEHPRKILLRRNCYMDRICVSKYSAKHLLYSFYSCLAGRYNAPKHTLVHQAL